MDDDVDICSYVENFFEERGLQVFTATTVKDALSLATTEKPHFVILDIRISKSDLQNRDGLLALKEIRKICPESKIVMVSGIEDEDIAQEASALGANGYIAKPLRLEELLMIVEKSPQ